MSVYEVSIAVCDDDGDILSIQRLVCAGDAPAAVDTAVASYARITGTDPDDVAARATIEVTLMPDAYLSLVRTSDDGTRP